MSTEPSASRCDLDALVEQRVEREQVLGVLRVEHQVAVAGGNRPTDDAARRRARSRTAGSSSQSVSTVAPHVSAWLQPPGPA